MGKIILSIVIFLAASVSYCQNQPLQITIKSDKQVYEAGDEIKLIANTKNNSDKEMIVFWSDEGPPEASGGGGTSLIPRRNPRVLTRGMNALCFLLGRKPRTLVRGASLINGKIQTLKSD